MPKKKIHPKWYHNAKVFYDGQLILKVGATVSSLNVATWSKIHPAYTGSKTIFDIEGQIRKFLIKYGWLTIDKIQRANNSTVS